MLQALGKLAQILAARDFQCAESREMRREPLRVQQRKTTLAQPLDERVQRDFRCVRDRVKHGLAKKRAA